MESRRKMGENDILYKDESYAIIGAAMKVHQVLGQGFAEKVYQDALEIEFKKRGIPYEREKQYQITYDGVVLNHIFQPDFVCYDKIIVELKAVVELDNGNREQCINYIHAANMKLGLLLNFRSSSLQQERFVRY